MQKIHRRIIAMAGAAAVTRDDASQVDVQLDDHFAVVKTMSDSESGHGTGG